MQIKINYKKNKILFNYHFENLKQDRYRVLTALITLFSSKAY